MMYKRLGAAPVQREETQKVTVAVASPDSSIHPGMVDRSSEYGLEKGKAMEIYLKFSADFTSASPNTVLTSLYAPFITINGVSLDRREYGDRELGMDDIDSSIFDGYNVVIRNVGSEPYSTMSILLLGGGTGNLDPSKTNIITISKDFPLTKGVTLGYDVTFVYNPTTRTWSVKGADNPKTGSPISGIPLAAAIGSAALGVASIPKRKKKEM